MAWNLHWKHLSAWFQYACGGSSCAVCRQHPSHSTLLHAFYVSRSSLTNFFPCAHTQTVIPMMLQDNRALCALCSSCAQGFGGLTLNTPVVDAAGTSSSMAEIDAHAPCPRLSVLRQAMAAADGGRGVQASARPASNCMACEHVCFVSQHLDVTVWMVRCRCMAPWMHGRACSVTGCSRCLTVCCRWLWRLQSTLHE